MTSLILQYGFTSAGYNFFICALGIEISLLLQGVIEMLVQEDDANSGEVCVIRWSKWHQKWVVKLPKALNISLKLWSISTYCRVYWSRCSILFKGRIFGSDCSNCFRLRPRQNRAPSGTNEVYVPSETVMGTWICRQILGQVYDWMLFSHSKSEFP